LRARLTGASGNLPRQVARLAGQTFNVSAGEALLAGSAPDSGHSAEMKNPGG
jgi:hypothetical protein